MHRSFNAPLIRPRSLIPSPRIGIIGGGQLAKMTATAAAQFGCEVVVLERQDDFPAHSVDTHALVGDWNDPEVVSQLTSLVDVVLLENEFVNLEALTPLQEQGHTIWPTTDTIARVQDKFRQKEAFVHAAIPVPRFAAVASRESVSYFGLPAVLKKRRNSYDGKGNATLNSQRDIAEAWGRLNENSEGLYVEEFCEFERELAVIVTRGQDGTTACYPVVETINREHICHMVLAPAPVPAGVAEAAKDMAVRAVACIGGVGSFGVEMFLLPDGRLLMNEIAPRVHNTGHYTIEACLCSQFENHIRAALGWPLGSTAMIAPAACMVNLLAYGAGSGVPLGLTDALAVPGARVHVYGKTRSERGRKMGHVTALGATREEACSLAQKAADYIQFGGDQ